MCRLIYLQKKTALSENYFIHFVSRFTFNKETRV